MTERTVPSFERRDFFPKRARFAVIVPFLNEGQRIGNQLRKMAPHADDVDVILVDGGSTDGAPGEELLAEGLVRTLLRTGRGLSAQMRVGLAVAVDDGYDGVVMIDGNDKDDPGAIADFVRHLRDGWDHVQGSRFVPGGRALNTPLARLVLIKLIHAPLISLSSGFRYTDTTNGFRAYSRGLLTDPRVQPFRDVFAKYELHYYLAIRAARLGLRVCEIPVTRAYPVGAPVPTKIAGVKGYWKILTTLMNAVFHRYDPEAS